MACGSPEELGTVLSGGYEAWERYQVQIGGEHEDYYDYDTNFTPFSIEV